MLLWRAGGSKWCSRRGETLTFRKSGALVEARRTFSHLGKLWRLKSMLPSRRNADFHILSAILGCRTWFERARTLVRACSTLVRACLNLVQAWFKHARTRVEHARTTVRERSNQVRARSNQVRACSNLGSSVPEPGSSALEPGSSALEPRCSSGGLEAQSGAPVGAKRLLLEKVMLSSRRDAHFLILGSFGVCNRCSRRGETLTFTCWAPS